MTYPKIALPIPKELRQIGSVSGAYHLETLICIHFVWCWGWLVMAMLDGWGKYHYYLVMSFRHIDYGYSFCLVVFMDCEKPSIYYAIRIPSMWGKHGLPAEWCLTHGTKLQYCPHVNLWKVGSVSYKWHSGQIYLSIYPFIYLFLF